MVRKSLKWLSETSREFLKSIHHFKRTFQLVFVLLLAPTYQISTSASYGHKIPVVVNNEEIDDIKFSPPAGFHHVTEITIELYMNQIRPLRNGKNVIELTGELIQSWQDNRLKWNQSEVKYASEVPLSKSSIWTPRITINEERISTLLLQAYDNDEVFVTASGRITWAQSITIRTMCYVSETFLKQSTFTCDLNMKPDKRMRDSIAISLKRTYYNHIIRVMDTNWKIDRVQYHPESTSDGSQLSVQYKNKRITIHMVKMHAHLYPNTLTMIAIAAFLINISFFLPPQIGYVKLSIPIFFLTLICVYSALQGKVEMRISKTLLDEYCVAAMTGICMFTVLMQCLTIKLWNRNPKAKPGLLISLFYLKLPISIGRIFCYLLQAQCFTFWRRSNLPINESRKNSQNSQGSVGDDEQGNNVRQGRLTEPEIKYARWLQNYGAVYKTIYDHDSIEIFSDKWRKAARINDRIGMLIVTFAICALTIQWLSSHHSLF